MMDGKLSTTAKVGANSFKELKAQKFEVLKMVKTNFGNSYHVE
jgi:hypothetical protein